MGDYYKIKKILLILIIVLTVIRIFKTSNVFASEAVEVTPTWNDGNYTVQADNNYLSIQQSTLNIQETVIDFYYYWWDNGSDTYKSYLRTQLLTIYRSMGASINRTSPAYVSFYRVNDASYQNVSLGFAIFGQGAIDNGTIVQRDATLSDGYKLINQPFYQYSLTQYSYKEYIRINDTTVTRFTSGTSYIACAEVGCYSSNWVGLFQHVGLINNTYDYNDLLASIQETNELNYTQNYYTKQAVQNTYSYLTNDNIEEISSLGISQPQVTEQVDLTDVLDSLEALLTNETYTTKFFTITLPNGRGSTFAISPELLENNLNRVGGQNIVSIIHAVWYIGLYGWYIFSLLGIYGKLLTGDLFHLVKGCSPVTNLVKMSVGTISGGKF